MSLPETPVFIPVDFMQDFLQESFEQIGCSQEESVRVTRRLIGANLRGHESYGVARMPRYVEWVQNGTLIPNQQIQLIQENEVISILDGGHGFGQSIGEQAVQIGVEKSLAQGVSVTALRNSGHLGRIGDWAELAAGSNVASLHMVNVRGSLLVAPFEGVERRGSTSPFCCGIPRADEPPVILDFATSLVAEGKALVALRGGTPLPEGAIIGPDGKLGNDPLPLYGAIPEGRYPDPNIGPGALTGFGLHKGSGLNFFMEMFAGALTGSGTSAGIQDTSKRRFCNGMLSVYFSLEFFHSDNWFAEEVRNYIDFYKSSKPSSPGGEVLIPGEAELRRMKERQKNGLPLAQTAWKDLIQSAEKIEVRRELLDQARRFFTQN